MTTLLAFVVALAVLVVFHELGHYWVARLCDVKVLRFSVGFGKIIYSTHIGKGETEWAISAVPLGGYVKMLDEREGEVAAHELSRAFNRKPVLQRMAIVVAGPLANLLLAIVLYWALFLNGVPGLKPIVGMVVPASPAAVAGLQPQEIITTVNGVAVPSWQELRWTLLNLALERGKVEVVGRLPNGEGRVHELDLSGLVPADLDGEFMQKLGLSLYTPRIVPVVGKLIEGKPAQRAGLQVGETIVSADGQDIADWDALVKVVSAHPGKPLALVLRNEAGVTRSLSVTPDSVQEQGHEVGKLGIAPQVDEHLFDTMRVEVSYGPVRALSEAWNKTLEVSVLSLRMMGKMIMGEVSVKNLSGPITIADYAGQSAQMGLGAYVGFLALISISLGILNLLPIPLLDGGHLLYYTAELVRGRPLSERVWEIGQHIGIALLATMMALALYNDITRLILG